ncbi:MAG: hypothetical protein R3D81_13230 [Thalassovita sp.]
MSIFAPEDYALIMGRLAGPVLVASAVAPLLGALLIQHYGAAAMLWVLMMGAVVPVAAAVILYWDILRDRQIHSL